MNIKISYEEALAKAPPPLRRKIEWSVNLLRKSEPLALKYDGKGFWCGFSGGKDSQALFHIAQLAGVKFNAFFSPTSIDPPQVIRFIRTNYPEVEFTPLKESIFTAFKRIKILPSQRIRWCCAVFKEKGGENKVTLTGVRKQESARRSKRNEVEISNHKFSGNLDEFAQYSEKRIKRMIKNLNQDEFAEAKENEIRCINGKDKIIINPILYWTDKDVWDFLNNIVNVPHCELYDPPYNSHRIGCIGCPMANIKNIRAQFKQFPHVKERWIKAIMDVRKDTYNATLSPPHAIQWHNQWNALFRRHGLLKPRTTSHSRLGGGKSSVEDYAERCGRNDKHLATFKEYGRKLGERCKFSDSVNGDSSAVNAIFDEQTERKVAEYIIEWWISKKSFKQWYADTFMQGTINFDE